MKSGLLLCLLSLAACPVTLPAEAAALPLVERLECSGESLRVCMDKLTTQTGVVIELPSELSGNPTYFRAERIGLSTCIDRAMVASGGSNFALQVDEGQKHATVFLLSDFRMGGAAKAAVSAGVANKAAQLPPGQQGGTDKQVRSQVATNAASSTMGGNATVQGEDDMTMMQLNAAREMAEIYRPNQNDIVDEFDGKSVTFAELQQMTKNMEQLRPRDDDVVDVVDGKKMTLKELTDIAKLAEKTYEQQVATASAAGGTVD